MRIFLVSFGENIEMKIELEINYLALKILSMHNKS